jgi:cation diffusion facilitator family transporter
MAERPDQASVGTRGGDHFRTERDAAVLALGAGAAIMGVKLIAWRLTGSSAVHGDAMESIVNVAASAMALWAVVQAHRPADRTHPYGHGRFEFLSASFEGVLIGAAAATIIWEAVQRLATGTTELREIGWGMALLAITAMANAALGWRLVRTGRRLGSAALDADGWHLLSDAATSVGAIAALVAVRTTGLAWIDPLAAIALAAMLVVLAVRTLRRSLGHLVDEQDAGDYEAVRAILDAHLEAPGRPAREPAIRGWHKLRTRHVGRHHWVDFHLQVDGSLDVRAGHAIASAIEHEIEEALGCGTDGGNATAHVEPAASGAE